MNRCPKYPYYKGFLVLNQVLLFLGGHGPAMRLLVLPSAAMFCSKGVWRSVHSCFSSCSAWQFGDGLVSNGPTLRRCCWVRGSSVVLSVGVCVIKHITSY